MEFNIADLFESVVDAVPDRTAVVSGDRRLTFAQLDERANRLAHAFLAQGVRPGDHVGLYLYNGTEFVEAMLAAFKIRAVPININYRYVEEELAFLLSNANVVLVMHEAELAPRLAAVKDQVKTLRSSIAVGAREGAVPAGSLAYDALLASSSPERRFEKRSGKDIYVIYTGGTTGMPRGVMWRHEDVFFAGLQGGNPGGPPIERPEELAINARERTEPLTFLPAAPFIHGAAQWAALIGLFGGGKIVLIPGRSFNAKMLCRLLEAERVNTITLVGDAMVRPIVEALAEPGAKYDTSSVFVISSAGALLSDSVKAALRGHLPDIMIIDSFGATEAGHQGSSLPGEDESKPRRPKFFMDATSTVFDDNMKPVEPGSGVIGKLARRGKIPLGYYNDPEKTAATFIVVDGERWVVPGDLATIEEDGCITVFGRGAVCINSGGEKIFPEEVESAIKAHASVLDAVVVGVPDERWGQRVAAIVQPRPGSQVTLETLEGHLRTRIAGYKIPRQLKIVDEILRHPSGKPDYRWAADVASEARKEQRG